MNIFAASHVANNTNIVLIESPRVYNTYRIAIQCGACDINGDINAPAIVNGTQKYTYTCGMQ